MNTPITLLVRMIFSIKQSLLKDYVLLHLWGGAKAAGHGLWYPPPSHDVGPVDCTQYKCDVNGKL